MPARFSQQRILHIKFKSSETTQGCTLKKFDAYITSGKLVIKLDHITLTRRYEQITKYLHQTEVTCKTIQACSRIEAITGKEIKYLKSIMTQIQTIYRFPTNRRRGIVDSIDGGIGSIAKSLSVQWTQTMKN